MQYYLFHFKRLRVTRSYATGQKGFHWPTHRSPEKGFFFFFLIIAIDYGLDSIAIDRESRAIKNVPLSYIGTRTTRVKQYYLFINVWLINGQSLP